MTTVITTSNSEVTTPTSYVSRWIAQSHGTYQKKTNDYYSSSSSLCDCRTLTTTPIIKPSTKVNPNHTTTWQAEAKSRMNAATAAAAAAMITDSSLNTPININNNEFQEKLHRVRALLDAKKQRLCRHLSSTSTAIPLVALSLPDQVHHSTTVGDQSPSPPIPSSSYFALENIYHSHDELLSSSNSPYIYNSCFHHHSSPSILPCLMEESPSDSGLSDGTKTTNHDDMIDSTRKHAAIIDLSKPLSKEEMLAIMQILRELWKKQFDCEIPDITIKSTLPTSPSFKRITNLSNNIKTQYHSTPALNKLSAELNDIKDKLKRFSTEHQQQTKSNESENSQIDYDDNPSCEDSIFVTFDTPSSPQELERMQAKKDALIRRQIQRREEQLMKKTERQALAAEGHDEYRLFEDYLAQRREEVDQRRATILQSHIEQKRLEADPISSHDYYFAAARTRNRLKRKASIQSFLSFDDDISYTGSSFDLISNDKSSNLIQTPKRSLTHFDFMSPSLTAPTAASTSKMNRAASICNINKHYDSFTSLNSKATIPTSSYSGSLMNLSKSQTPKRRLIEDNFDQSLLSASTTSLTTSIAGTRLARSQTLLSTKSNKQAIINSLKQVALAGPANERQREVITREIELSEARHFVLLFRDHRLQFRAVYMYIPETDIIEKLHGIGPNIITEVMVDKWFKYNSGKRFTNIPIKHFSIQCDAIIIHNDFWQKKLLMHVNRLH